MISASFLSIKNNLKENIKKLDQTPIDYLHLDIMDGKFVSNKTWEFNEIKDLLEETTKPLDVHLMVEDVDKYIDDYVTLNPEYITFHYEVDKDINELINKIKSKNIKVGISIKPSTDTKVLIPYLNLIDLVLIMSVEPGMGGQDFIPTSVFKVSELKKLRTDNNYSYLISIDGGINHQNISLIDTDIKVIGSTITNNDNYEEQVKKLKNYEK